MEGDVHPGADNGTGGLRVAIVGAGPSGFYSALTLLGHGAVARVDMFDRLPTPYGLVRFGVAPDHPKIKSVIKVYERGVEAAGDKFRFFGNVEVGRDVTMADLGSRYHAVVLTYGAQSDRRLGIPGEDLPGVYAAREFVAWYNGHPDFRDKEFNLSGRRAMVVGVGNVAIDVARMLLRSPAELAVTDVAPYAEEALVASGVEEVAVVARRGPLQTKATPVELREFSRMADADLVVTEEDLTLDPVSAAIVEAGEAPRQNLKNIEVMRELGLRAPRPGRKVVRLFFHRSPVELMGDGRLEAVRLRLNSLERTPEGWLKVKPTDDTEVVPCHALFRAIGYLVEPLEGVPFDSRHHRIPHAEGQVLSEPGGDPVPGLFVAGWAKRGPSGVIGTNKPDAVETVTTLLAAAAAGGLPEPVAPDVAELLRDRGVRPVSFDQWKRLDALEVTAGEGQGRPRVKFTAVSEMLAALSESAPSPA